MTPVASSDTVTSWLLLLLLSASFGSIAPFPFALYLPPVFSPASGMSVIKYALFSTEDLCTCYSFSWGQPSSKTLNVHHHLIFEVSDNLRINPQKDFTQPPSKTASSLPTVAFHHIALIHPLHRTCQC